MEGIAPIRSSPFNTRVNMLNRKTKKRNTEAITREYSKLLISYNCGKDFRNKKTLTQVAESSLCDTNLKDQACKKHQTEKKKKHLCCFLHCHFVILSSVIDHNCIYRSKHTKSHLYTELIHLKCQLRRLLSFLQKRGFVEIKWWRLLIFNI